MDTANENCFVCGLNVKNSGFVLGTSQTFYTKTALLTKICQLVGDDLVVVASLEEKVCKRCMALIDKCDRLELELFKNKNLFNKFVRNKYNLKNEVYTKKTLEGPNSSQGDNQLGETITLETPKCADNSKDEAQTKFESSILDKSLSICQKKGIRSAGHGKLNQEELGKSEVRKEKDNLDHSDVIIDFVVPSENNDFSEETINPLTSDNSFVADINSIISEAVSLSELAQNKVRKEEVILDHSDVIIDFVVPSENNDFSEGTINPLTSDNSFVADINSIISEAVSPSDQKITNSVSRKILNSTSIQKSNLNTNITKRKFVEKHLKNKYETTSSLETEHSQSNEKCGPNVFSEELSRVEDLQKGILYNVKLIENANQTLLNFKSNPVIKTSHIKHLKKITSKSEICSGRVRCKFCKIDFDYEELATHMENHYKNNAFNCTYCTKVFKSKHGLEYHVCLKHTGKFNFCCDQCGKGFMRKINLEEHYSNHKQEHLYICDICGKKFTYKGSYWIHKKWHSNPTPYKCNDCGQLFKHSSVLAVHRRRHTGERPYKCSVCPKTFICTTSFKQHTMKHTKNYPYTCDKCDSGFTTQFKYAKHMSKEHDVIIISKKVKKENKIVIDNT